MPEGLKKALKALPSGRPSHEFEGRIYRKEVGLVPRFGLQLETFNARNFPVPVPTAPPERFKYLDIGFFRHAEAHRGEIGGSEAISLQV